VVCQAEHGDKGRGNGVVVTKEPAVHDDVGFEGSLLYLTKQLELLMRSRLDETVGVENLTTLQYTALTVLKRRPDMTAAALARGAFVRAQTMAQMVNALDERGFIQRRRDPDNKRQFLISLTAKGYAVIDRLSGSVAEIEQRMVSALDDDETAAFRKSLRLCRDSLTRADDS